MRNYLHYGTELEMDRLLHRLIVKQNNKISIFENNRISINDLSHVMTSHLK